MLAWTESEFEQWFLENPVLPGDERLLVIDSHHPFGPVVDLFALDAQAVPISIEVKNEAAHNRVAAQLLRYLPRCHRIGVADLIALRKELPSLFRVAFGRGLPATIPPDRRLTMVAPSFGPQLGLAVRALHDYMPDVKFQLVRATRRDDGGFDLALHEPPDVAYASALAPGTIGLKPSLTRDHFRVVVVVDGGQGGAPVLWQVGHYKGVRLTPLGDDAVRRRSLRRDNWVVVPVGELEGLDLAHPGEHHRLRRRPVESAFILGQVTTAGDRWIYYVKRGSTARLMASADVGRLPSPSNGRLVQTGNAPDSHKIVYTRRDAS